ncbi:C2H2-type zinc finger protein [Endozoicomonas sp. ISHI1]|uniref:C2H2-type zinc finger protein n=1 Tax=Endozoicomonas sp. ISHI1 TaxID=2825882 RepID=UPI00214774E9|nr:C2H2-type zinc finger protein [Endozoicomonas sp. ISHI1]
MQVLVFVPFVCPVESQTYRFTVEVNQNRASTSQIFSIKTEPGTLSAMPMTDWGPMQNEPSHITRTNVYPESGSLPYDKPCRRNKLQIITLMYETGGGNDSRSTGPEDHDQSFNSRSEKSHYPYDNDHNDENSGRPTDSRHSLDENCHEQPCCHRQGRCIFAPSTSIQCRSTSDDPFAYRTDVYMQIGDQESGLESRPTEDPTVVSGAESTTGPALTLNPSPAKKQRKAGSKKCRCDHPGCERSFSSQDSLSTHKRQYHTGEQTCPECQKTLHNVKALSNHRRKDHTPEQTCPECQKTLPNEKALSDHKTQYHTGEQTCPECQKTLPNTQALSNHKRKDHTPEQTCRECQKTLPNAKALSVHKRKDHTSEQTCPECQKTLPNSQALSNHKSQYHTGEQTCPECQKILPNPQALSYHKRKDHTPAQTCPECQKTLPNVQALSNHKRKYHTPKRTCPECQKTLPNAQALSAHKRKDHTPEQTCLDCQKTLSNAQALSVHKSQYHTGEQTCLECQKTLPNVQALSNHRRQHRKRKLDGSKSSD